MKLNDKLQLTLSGDYQTEKLRSRNEFADFFFGYDTNNPENIQPNLFLDQIAYPRNGRRREFNLAFNFRFEPRPWLTLTAGARYTRFNIWDDNVRKFIDNGGILQANRGVTYTDIKQVASQEDYRRYLEAKKRIDEAAAQQDFSKISDQTQADYDKISPDERGVPYLADTVVLNWEKDRYGKLHSAEHPLLARSAEFGASIPNPAYDANNTDSPRYVQRYDLSSINGTQALETPLTAEEQRRALKQSAGGWAPAASVTLNLTDNARAYLRYTETLRYPSIFEGTYGLNISPRGSDFAASQTRYGYLWKPERGKNIEIGYIHDLTALFPKMRKADFRVNYFHNTTKNIIDRNENLEFEQYDKQTRTGAELSALFDSGRYYGSLGVLRNIRNEVCDDGASFHNYLQELVLLDRIADNKGQGSFARVPQCFPGGVNREGFLVTMQQPRWSVDAELGARLKGGKIEFGTRFHWHNAPHKTRAPAWNGFIDSAKGHFQTPDRQNALAIELDASRNADLTWAAVATIDAYLRYRISKNLTAEIVGTNLTDRYYMDPFSRSYMPAPGELSGLALPANGKNGKRPSEKIHFQTACSYFAHAEPNVGCVAPRRRTRSLPLNASLSCLPTRNRVRGLRHTPCLNGRGRLKTAKQRSSCRSDTCIRHPTRQNDPAGKCRI
ncbi:TonB-dependent receptor domain-containing protein [Neisseria bacilliformis]|uniref:TonB-dependent receptor domain-containing protein n=2 Tax=Neisseria bacilliformis TaxID=267212 RepID=UPI0028E901C0|nr:TonB-dependent receptor [Neisseria bacilliformis]